ncbi:MAG: DUF456 domain-containing protein [Calditrichia bacterium]|nr:DUF456 domain-containing protein [Calditrichia bacterium]
MLEVLGIIFAIIILLLGMLGTIIPGLPGLPLMWGVYAVYGFLTDWKDVTFNIVAVFLLITVIAYIFDYAASVMGAKKYGASTAGIIGAIIGLILGVIFFNIIRLIIGPVIGAIVGELLKGKETDQAIMAGWGTFIGFLASTIVRFSIAVIYFFYFIIRLF